MNNILIVLIIALLVCYLTKNKEHYTESHRDCSKESIDSAFYNYNTNNVNRNIRPI